jgi:zinc transport system permease protein
MTELATMMSYEFMRNAVLAGLLASLLCGVVGTFVVVNRLVFATGGISHAAFGGLGLFYYLGLSPLPGAVVAALLCALVLGLAGAERFRSHDALIGVLWSAGMAIGIVFMQLAPGYTPDLTAILFGDILSVTRGQLGLALVLDLAVLTTIGLFFKEFVAVSFDESFAAVQRKPVKLLLTLLLLLIAASIVMLIQTVGIILVIALLSIPPLIGLQLVRDFRALIAASVATSLLMTMAGLALSYRYDLPSGPAIILLGTAALLGVTGLRSMAARRRSERVRSAAGVSQSDVT